MVLTTPFGKWLDAGCPDDFEYDGMRVDAQWVIVVEHEAIADSRPGSQPTDLEDEDCDRLSTPRGSTNVDAIEYLSGVRPHIP
jgi:hypothetical protein